MKKNIKILLSVILIIGILLFNVKVYAETDVAKITLSPNKTNLNIGDEVEVEVNLSDLTVQNGVIGIVGQLEYDQDIFEVKYMSDSSIEEEVGLDELKEELELDTLKIIFYKDEGWYLAYSDVEGGDGAVLAGETTGEPAKSSASIGKIKLKVKNTATTTTTSVKLNTISLIANDGLGTTHDISAESTVNFKINAVKESGTKTEKNEQNTNSGEAYNVATNTTAPDAGSEDIIPIIFVLAILTIVALIKVLKYKDI